MAEHSYSFIFFNLVPLFFLYFIGVRAGKKSEIPVEARSVHPSPLLVVELPSVPPIACPFETAIASVISSALPRPPVNLAHTAPKNSESLLRWEKKVLDENAKQRRHSSVSKVPLTGPSPVSSRTRTSLKRSSSLACDDGVDRGMCTDKDRTEVSLRKALMRRRSKECPEIKRGRRSEVSD